MTEGETTTHGDSLARIAVALEQRARDEKALARLERWEKYARDTLVDIGAMDNVVGQKARNVLLRIGGPES